MKAMPTLIKNKAEKMTNKVWSKLKSRKRKQIVPKPFR